MIETKLKQVIESILAESFAGKISTIRFEALGGGSVNQAYQITIDKNQKFFCKINSASRFPSMFTKEENGLLFLAEQRMISTPAVIRKVESGENQILILQWIEQGVKTQRFWESFGSQLAALHSVSWSGSDGAPMFGYPEDNYLGALTQSNMAMGTWNDFFIHQRLEKQRKLAVDGLLLDSGSAGHFDKLYKKLPEIFSDQPSSLLHGDLWHGNFLCDQNARPVLIDPAVYFGHRSVDLAMTTLFGGFDKKFYEAYHYQSPFPVNCRQQWEICNLYPLLVHLNLFGKSYLSAILQTVNRF